MRTVMGAAVAAVLTAGAVACAPEEPEPEPTHLRFATEEEAFAAAEEVYRAYVAAVNRGLDDPTDQSALDFLGGRAHEASRNDREELRIGGHRLGGSVDLLSFSGLNADVGVGIPRVVGLICEDVREYRLLDESGADISPDGRPDVVGMTVEFVPDTERLKIVRFLDPEDGQCDGLLD